MKLFINRKLNIHNPETVRINFSKNVPSACRSAPYLRFCKLSRDINVKQFYKSLNVSSLRCTSYQRIQRVSLFNIMHWIPHILFYLIIDFLFASLSITYVTSKLGTDRFKAAKCLISWYQIKMLHFQTNEISDQLINGGYLYSSYTLQSTVYTTNKWSIKHIWQQKPTQRNLRWYSQNSLLLFPRCHCWKTSIWN